MNRHTITPDGCVHEQDNYKLDLHGYGTTASVLVHERGSNTYRRLRDDSLLAAREYWRRTAPFWAGVRAAWAETTSRHSSFTFAEGVSAKDIWDTLFEWAEEYGNKPDGGDYAIRQARAYIDSALMAHPGLRAEY